MAIVKKVRFEIGSLVLCGKHAMSTGHALLFRGVSGEWVSEGPEHDGVCEKCKRENLHYQAMKDDY